MLPNSVMLGRRTRHDGRSIFAIDGDRCVTSLEMTEDVLKAARLLQQAGVVEGAIVGLEVRDRLMHWRLVLACELLGAVTFSFHDRRPNLIPYRQFVERCDWLISSEAELTSSGLDAVPRMILADDLARTMCDEVVGLGDWSLFERWFDPNHPNHFGSSSGTTSKQKIFCLTTQMMMRRVASNIHMIKGLRRLPRFISIYNMSSLGAFLGMSAAVAMGGSVVVTLPDTFMEDIARHDANCSKLVSGDFEALLLDCPDDHRRSDEFWIGVDGGAVSPAIVDLALSRLATDVSLIYASGETGNISVRSGHQPARFLPGASVRITDPEGLEVGAGTVGTIQVRTETMISGYFEDAELTRSSFRDGWFNTADLGRIEVDGSLSMLGRAGDVVNLRGNKVFLAPIEAILSQLTGVTAVVITTIAGRQCETMIGVAVETTNACDVAALKLAVVTRLSGYGNTIHIHMAPSLPRTETGKVNRAAVKDLVQNAFLAMPEPAFT